MFKYLILFSISFYLVLLIGGEDRGQQRMGLAGAYAVDAPPLVPPEETLAEDPVAVAETAPAATLPADTLRILPAPEPATVQPASLSETPENPMNTPSVTLRTITAEAANVRNGASRNAAVIGRLDRGEIVQWLGQSGDWIHIRIEGDGIDGYVHRRLVSTDPPALTASSLFAVTD